MRALLPIGLAAVGTAVLSAGLLVASFVEFGLTGRALVGAVMCPTLVLLSAIDIRHRLLPNPIVLPTVAVVAVIVAVAQPSAFVAHLLAGLALGLCFFAFAAIFPGSLGMGDAKLGLLLGMALGSRTISAVMIAFMAVFVVALWILAKGGLSARKTSIPFGPFLALGAIAAFFLT